MKKTFVSLLAFLLIAVNNYSQNVGINFPTPDYPLDILKTGGGYAIRLLNPSSTTGSSVHLLFTNSASYSSTPFFSAYIGAVRQSAGANALVFGTGNTFGVPGERMRIDSAGNIGIGTFTPDTRLHVINGTDLTLSGGGYFQLGDSPALNLLFDNNEIQCRNNGTAANLLLQKDGGKIGIGTSSPDTKVHIEGGSDLSLSGGGHLQLGSTTGANLVFDNNEIQGRSNGAASDLYIQKDGGKIAIGTSTLATGYLVSVDGKMICEEIRVELKANWPDYVFNDDHKLPGLASIEKFIRINKHLPGIPSALQVKKEGFELGDMNKRLLEKIEELTLYLIDQDKKIIILQTQLQQMQKKN